MGQAINKITCYTIGGETQLVGDKTLAKWAGSWESWETYIDADGTNTQYAYLDEVWQLAYDHIWRFSRRRK